jgi:hypothetical protein
MYYHCNGHTMEKMILNLTCGVALMQDPLSIRCLWPFMTYHIEVLRSLTVLFHHPCERIHGEISFVMLDFKDQRCGESPRVKMGQRGKLIRHTRMPKQIRTISYETRLHVRIGPEWHTLVNPPSTIKSVAFTKLDSSLARKTTAMACSVVVLSRFIGQWTARR